MDQIKKISNNSLLVYFARISDFVIGIVTMSIVARYLNVQSFGKYIFIMTIGWIFYTLVAMGVEQIILREIARIKEKASNFLGTGLFINGLMFLITILVYSLSIPFLGLENIILIALFLNFFSELTKVFLRTTISAFLAFEKMGYDALLTFISRILILILTVIVAYFDLGFIFLFSALILGNGTGLCFGFYICHRKFKIQKVTTSRNELKFLLKESFPIAVKMVSQQLYFYIGVFVVKLLSDDSGVAFFQGPNKMVTLLQLVPVAFLTAFAPLLSRLAVSDESRSQLENIYQKAFKFLFIISFPMSVLGMVLAPKIILLIFGGGFTGAVISLQILIWAVNFLYLDNLFSFILTSIDKQKLLITSNLLCVVTNVITSFILVSRYGYVGAAWGALIAYGVLFISNFYFVTRTLRCVPKKQGILQPIIGSFLTGFIIFKLLHLNLVFLILCSLIVYPVLIYALKTFSLDEKEVLKRAVFRT